MKKACIRICFIVVGLCLSVGALAFDSSVIRHDFFTPQEEALVEEALPTTIKCIVVKQPSQCGITEFFVDKFSVAQLKEIFVKSKVVQIRSNTVNGQRIISLEFEQPKGIDTLGGVIDFVIVGGMAKPKTVSYIETSL